MQKNILIPLAIIIIGVFIGGLLLLSGHNKDNPLNANVAQANLRKVELEITNMFCVGCRSSVVNSIIALPGVAQADADPRTDSGWVIYNSEKTTKEQIVAASIFQAYPAKILDDQKYSGGIKNGQAAEIPSGVERKLNLLAQKLQERGITLEPFFQEELDNAISGGYWEKVENLLDNFLTNL